VTVLCVEEENRSHIVESRVCLTREFVKLSDYGALSDMDRSILKGPLNFD
jgi:hypothetical protein